MFNILCGLTAVVLALSGIWHWHALFFVVLKGLLPLSLLFAGLVSIISGVSNLRARRRPKTKGHGGT